LADGLGREQLALSGAAKAIKAQVDGEFDAHCWVGALQSDCILIYVDDSAIVAPLRLRWSNTILKALQAEKEFSRIRRVVFEHGRGGAGFRR